MAEVEITGRDVNNGRLALDSEVNFTVDVVGPGRHFKGKEIGRGFQVDGVEDGLIVILDYEKLQTFACSLQLFYFAELDCFSGRNFSVRFLALVFGRSFLDDLVLFL